MEQNSRNYKFQNLYCRYYILYIFILTSIFICSCGNIEMRDRAKQHSQWVNERQF
jgi:hypothetical protein